MGRVAKELSAMAIRKMNTPGLFAVGGATGLYVAIMKSGSKSWIFRFRMGSSAYEMGMGSLTDVSLAEARTEARRLRAMVREGMNPLEIRRAKKRAALLEQQNTITFYAAAQAFIAARSAEWKNAKHRQQWENTLRDYAYPHIGHLPVADIIRPDILRCLASIWTTKTETATRVQNRIERVLDWSIAAGYRKDVENPARWKNGLDALLPKPSEVKKTRHFPALPYLRMNEFMQALHQHEGMAARCLEWCILTACRTGMARAAEWHEFDLAARTWTVPASRMKGRRSQAKDFVVPISDAGIDLLARIPRFAGQSLVFPGKGGAPLSDMGMTALLRRMGFADKNGASITAHGFRSSFRDWAADCTAFSDSVCEAALAHALDSKVESAYRRGDMLEKRRHLMQAWADFCNTPNSASGAVIPLRSAG